MPLFSIIVPVFNSLPFLSDCVESILQQTDSDFELLLVDDGSTDGSGALCDTFAQKDARIHAFHKSNGGAASARNYGLDHANGDCILFVDGDDTLAPNCLLSLKSKLAADTLLIFGMSFDFYQGNRIVRQELLSCNHQGRYSPDDVAGCFDRFFLDNQLSSACNKVFDHVLIETNHLRFLDGMALYEDFHFVLQYLRYAASVCCIPELFYHYRHTIDQSHSNQRISSLNKLQEDLSCLIQALRSLYDCYPEKSILSVAANLYLELLSQHLLQKKNLLPSKLKPALTQYCAEPVFHEILSLGGQLQEPHTRLLSDVQKNHFVKISCRYLLRKTKVRLKRRIRRIICKQF